MPLFNGKDLTGWKTHPSQPGNWRVEKGVLIGSGAAESYLYSERGDYKDFHVRAEAQHQRRWQKRAVLPALRSTWPTNNPSMPLAYDAQINSTDKFSDKPEAYMSAIARK